MDRNNPFVISGYAGDSTFCDRVEETKNLIWLLQNGHNVVLTSPRRIGKTELIKHVFSQPEISSEYITVTVDIYSTRNLAEFALSLGKAITDALKPRGKKIVDGFLNFVNSLRTELTFDANGMPVWSLGIGRNFYPETTLEEIFEFISKSKKHCLIAIDEFQQIMKYQNGDQVEALLRAHVQNCNNANFIFSGSHQHMMTELFLTPSRPFYQASTMMGLPLLSLDVYTEFCQRLFADNGKQLEAATVEDVYRRFDGITAYMQKAMNALFGNTKAGELCRRESVDPAIEFLLNQANDAYLSLFYQLTERQSATLFAIAAEGCVINYSSGEFIRKFNLLSPSSVKSTIKTLLEREIISSTHEGYIVYDKFFQLWLLRHFKE